MSSTSEAFDQKSSVGISGDNLLLGVLFALLAMFLYGVTETAAKWLTGGFHPTQILLIRCVASFALAYFIARNSGGWAVLHTAQPWTQFFRGMSGSVSMLLAVYAYSLMPLAEAVSIVYAAPIVVTLLSGPILGETVGLRRMTAVGVGFIGVVLIVRPGDGVFEPAALVALAAMFLYALSNVFTRKLGKTDRGLTTLIYTQFCFVAICAPFQPFVWVTPSVGLDIGLFALVALAGAVAQYFLTASYQHAPAAVIAPFDYTAILWATLFGFAIWGEAPSFVSALGIAIVVAAGTYIAYREIKVWPPTGRGPVQLWARRRPS